MRRVLVCGGRDFGNDEAARAAFKEHWGNRKPTHMAELMFDAGEVDRSIVVRTLAKLHVESAFSVVISGMARGVDSIAAEWAREMGIEVLPFPADWETHGKAAGPIRNRRMLVGGKPDIVVAFPGGRGTADMVRQAKAAGVQVVVVDRQGRWS